MRDDTTDVTDDSGAYEVYRGADGRLEEEMVPELYDYFYASPKMHQILEGIHEFDKAHVVMLLEQDIIPEEAGVQILRGLKRIEEEGVVETRRELGGHFHTGEAYLSEEYGEATAGWIHVGRSSGDLGRTGARIVARDELLETMAGLNNLREAFLNLAADNRRTVVTGFTHMQHAQPTTFAHYLLSFEHAFQRDFQRLLQAYEQTNVSPAGSAILTGSSYSFDREMTMELMGFDDLHTNTMDAVFNSDWGLNIHATLMTFYSTVAKFAEELAVFSTYEYGLVELADRFCGTSSIMPQKKNPYLAEFVSGTSGTVYGDAMESFVGSKGPHGRLDTMWAGFQNLWNSFELVSAVLSTLPEAVASLQVNEERMRQTANEQWTQATDVADAIVRETDTPFRTAHQIVAVLIRVCIDESINPSAVTPDLIDDIAEEIAGERVNLSKESLHAALDPERCVESRTLTGGPNPENVADVIAQDRSQLDADRTAINDRREHLEQAEDALDAQIDAWLV